MIGGKLTLFPLLFLLGSFYLIQLGVNHHQLVKGRHQLHSHYYSSNNPGFTAFLVPSHLSSRKVREQGGFRTFLNDPRPGGERPAATTALQSSPPAAGAPLEWRGAQQISKLTESVSVSVFDIEKIKQVLPHRFPFLLIDKVLEFEPGKKSGWRQANHLQ